MSEQLTLAAETREQVGKGASRSLRRAGRVPAVVYGNKQEPLAIHVEEKALMRLLMTGHFMNSVVMIENGKTPIRTLPKDVTFDVVTDRPVHADFLRIGEHTTVHVNVPVVFTDEELSKGIKRGGVLNVVRHELELICDAADIPGEIEISLKGMDVGDSIHISQVKLPKGTKSAIDDRDFTIATLIAPSALKSEAIEQAAEEAAEAEAAHEEHVAEVEAAEAEADAATEDGEGAGEA
jgi:large subunit ribosomal protein L25